MLNEVSLQDPHAEENQSTKLSSDLHICIRAFVDVHTHIERIALKENNFNFEKIHRVQKKKDLLSPKKSQHNFINISRKKTGNSTRKTLIHERLQNYISRKYMIYQRKSIQNSELSEIVDLQKKEKPNVITSAL